MRDAHAPRCGQARARPATCGAPRNWPRNWARRLPSALLALLALLLAPGSRVSAEPVHLRREVLDAHRFDTRLNEQLVTLPISRWAEAREFQLTYFRPDGPGPFPLAVLHHGRGPDRTSPSRQRSVPLARYLVRRGFAVLVPTRVGYGGLRDELDPEHSRGRCDEAALDTQAAAIIAHTEAALAFARAQPWADSTRVLLVGGSVGGHGVIANGAQPPNGLVGIVNFAGGTGGDPRRRPGQPCNPERLLRSFAKAAKGSRAPTIWIYAENDRFWGPEHPIAWHKAFVAAGGKAEFVRLPPIGDDGHQLVVAGFSHWRPRLDAFLAGLGFAPPRTIDAPEPSGYARIDEVDRLPLVSETARKGYERFLSGDLPRAFVIGQSSFWSYKAASPDALREALKDCETRAKAACRPYAVDDQVVWRP